MPDGEPIACTQHRNGDRDIWVVNADGSNAWRLAKTPRRDEFEVDWSPAGGRIAFGTGGWASDIYVMNTNRTNLRNLTAKLGRWSGEIDRSPDGGRIAFMRRERGRNDVYVIDAEDRKSVRLTNNAVSDREPVWSPDGSTIAFLRSAEEDSQPLRLNCCPPRGAVPARST